MHAVSLMPASCIDGMVCCMKVTFNIDEAVAKRLKVEAALRGRTMSSLVEDALCKLLDTPEARPPLPPLPSWDMGGALVDISDRRAVYEALDRERNERLYGRPAGAQLEDESP
jgi:plasmid stability protein